MLRLARAEQARPILHGRGGARVAPARDGKRVLLEERCNDRRVYRSRKPKELRREDPSFTSSQENTAESLVLIMQGAMRKTWPQTQ